MFQCTIWSLLPPIIAIVLALITKEVYSSLFIGILCGGLLYSEFNLVGTMEHVFVDGFIGNVADAWNVGILIFLVILGAMVQLMTNAGGSAAFGRWSVEHVKTKLGAQCCTILLGMLIFIDDYFNCLTVGSVMRPLTDKHGISREKLAYLIDATAAPVCIIAPISSWAAAVTGMVEGVNGLSLFVKAIPYNYYALLTILMMFVLAIGKFDYGPMNLAERAELLEARQGKKIHPSMTGADDTEFGRKVSEKGTVAHLVIPVIVLIICCVIGMIYTGGFFDGESFVDSFANSDASVGLVYGSVVALIFTMLFNMITKVMPFKRCMLALTDGFKAMVPAILILTMAWTLNSMTKSLGAAEYVAGIVEGFADNNAIMSFLPVVVFLIGCGLAFATGTSWGTFGILIPIIVPVFNADINNELMIICISACMAGAVCGDHCSPISDTTIMASAGADCNHIQHVSTQLPYALTAAVLSAVSYIFAGFIRSTWICLAFGVVLTIVTLLVIKAATRKSREVEA